MRLDTTAANIGISRLVQPKHTKDDLFPGDHLGVRVLHAPPDASVDVIIIHGITGHPYRTFVAHDKTYWPTQLLPRDIPQARILSFGYDADVVRFLGPAGQNNIREHAATLISDIAAVRADDGSATRPIILIVHSLGGLLAKKALCLSETAVEPHEKQLHQTVLAVAFLGTPHRGSDLAPFATGVARILKASGTRTNVDIVRLLQRDSEALAEIETEFGIWLRKNLAFKLTCFYEEHEVAGIGMVVGKASAKISGYPQLPIPANHMDMVRFATVYDTGYRRLLGELRRWLRKDDDVKSNSRTGAGDALDFPGCMATLSFPEMNHRGADIEAAAEGTCKWILDHPVYQQWCANGQGLLWIKGKPGSGKSTLMKYLLRQAEGSPSSSTLAVWFFFHGRGTELQMSPVGLFRAILHQIGEAYPQAIRALIKQYLNYQQTSSVWSWRPQDLEDLLISDVVPALLKYTNLSICIDALDECGEAEARRLVSFFSRAHDRASSNPHRMSICFSCRHYPIIAPDICEQIVVESANDDDISTYISQMLSPHVSNAEELQTLRHELEKGARQVFLWVVVVIPQITWRYNEGQTLQQILEHIRRIPPELDSLYESLIRELSNKSASESMRLFQIICYSRENLNIAQLREAFNFHGDHQTATRSLKEWRAIGAVKTDDQMRRKLRTLSAGLAEETASGVQLTHQTVQDFLVSKGFAMLEGVEGKTLEQLAGEGNNMLARSCLLYLIALSSIITPSAVSALDLHQILLRDPFLGYSARHWLPHSSAAETAGISQAGILEYLGPSRTFVIDAWSSAAFLDHVGRRESGEPTRDVFTAPQERTTLLHEAVKYNLESLVKRMLEESPTGIESTDSTKRLPLTYALWAASESIAKLLLERIDGADINKRLYSGSLSFTAFQLAVGNGREQIALEISDLPMFMWEENMDIEVDLTWGENAIFSFSSTAFQTALRSTCTVADLAVAQGFGRILDDILKLPQHAADLDFPNLCFVAVSHKQARMLQRLLGMVGQTNERQYRFRESAKCGTILHRTVELSFDEGLNILLSAHFVELNNVDSSHLTAVHIAVLDGKTTCLQQLLLCARVRVNERDIIGNTPLHQAIKHGFTDSVSLLCACSRVDPNVANHRGERPLDLAIQKKDLESLALLLDRTDIEIDRRDGAGKTILWHAVHNGDNCAARLLLESGAEPLMHLRDGYGALPSLALAEQDVIEALERLDSANRWTPCDAVFGLIWPDDRAQFGAHVELAGSCDGEGNTLLMWAIIKGWDVEALSLVYGDAGQSHLDRPNYEGLSPLMACLKFRRFSVARRLVRHTMVDLERSDSAGRDIDWYLSQYAGADAEGREVRRLVRTRLRSASTVAVPVVEKTPQLVVDRWIGRYHIQMVKVPKGSFKSESPLLLSGPGDKSGGGSSTSWWARRRARSGRSSGLDSTSARRSRDFPLSESTGSDEASTLDDHAGTSTSQLTVSSKLGASSQAELPADPTPPANDAEQTISITRNNEEITRPAASPPAETVAGSGSASLPAASVANEQPVTDDGAGGNTHGEN